MIFGRVCVTCDDNGDYHDKIVVTSIDFIGRRSICGHYLQGEGSFWEPPTKTMTRVIDLIVGGRGEEIKF